jgi:short-subunit dehydrogenase
MHHALVTGASAGIGAALARRLHTAGYRVSLVARREPELRALADELGRDALALPADLLDPDDAWLQRAQDALGPVDVLVNNAGVQIIGPTEAVDLDRAERSLQLNLTVPLRLIRTLLPAMKARGRGHIVNVASMAALAPTPGMTWYNAGKAGLAGASEALRGELLGSGVEVLTVYPGIIDDTDMGIHGLAQYGGDDAWILRMQPTGTAEELARRVVHAMEAGQARLIWPTSNALARHFPAATRWLMDRFAPRPSAESP